MAKQQYRIYDSFDWMSNSGNGIVVIYNPPASGKKLTLSQFELQNMTSLNPTAFGAAASPATMCSIFYTTINRGTVMTPSPMDTNYPWPSGVVASIGATIQSAPAAGQIIRRVAITKQMLPGGAGWIGMNSNIGIDTSGIYTRQKGGSLPGVTAIAVNPGETVCFGIQTLTSTIPLKLYAMVRVDGHCYAINKNFTMKSATETMLAIENEAGSGKVIELFELSVEEMGTYDSPYFQIVPTGQLDATATSDPTKLVTPSKMDTDYPDAPFKVYKDIPFLPLGVPVNYLSDASSGSPKGFNYLKTKDFLGPVYRTVFPENEGQNSHAAPSATSTMDSLGTYTSQRMNDVLVRGAGITINEGEGIALVSGAETAVTSNPVGMSGWSAWNIGATITVESKYSPTLTISGLQSGTEVRIYDALMNELAGVESSGTTFQYSYSYDADQDVTIVIHSLGYLPIRLENFTLGAESQTIPVQQIADRQYQNA